jgi:hypothetical protein
MIVRVYPSLSAQDRDDAQYWRAQPMNERILQVWKLSEAQWRLRGEFPDESGLPRSSLIRGLRPRTPFTLTRGGPFAPLRSRELGRCAPSLHAFTANNVRFLIVGAYALGVHGRPRATADLDVWVDATPENAANVMLALEQFGAPLGEVTVDDFSRPGIVFQMGLPPVRIDVLTTLTGLTFSEAWPGRVRAAFGPITVDVIGREAFIRNKRATGRARDLGDLEALGE